MNKFKDILGNEGMDQDCLATCALAELCLLEGCRKTYAARQVKDTATGIFIAKAAPVVNLVMKRHGLATVMRAIPSRRRQRRAAKARARKENE